MPTKNRSIGRITCYAAEPVTSATPSRIVIVGISGTGKSAFSRRASTALGLPLYHMDNILWEENWTEAPLQKVDLALTEIAESATWIIEGWIDYYSQAILERADLVIYLDYAGCVAAWGGFRRAWRHCRVARPELPEGCTDSLSLEYLKVMLLRQERPHIESILRKFQPRVLLRCTSRKDAERILRQLGETA